LKYQCFPLVFLVPNYKVVWFHLRKREPIALPSPLTIRESRIALPRAEAAPAGAQARRKSSPFGTHVRSPRVPPRRYRALRMFRQANIFVGP